MKWTALLLSTLAVSATAQSFCTTVNVTVPGTANPYLAGLRAGTQAAYGDSAPQQSPKLVPLSLAHGTYVTFSAEGRVQHHPFRPPRWDSPSGALLVLHRPEHGISAIAAPIDSLLGVFLGDEPANELPTPPAIKFGSLGWNFPTLEPQLKQVFYIGNGAARTGKKTMVPRRFFVPKGATRLYLAVMDEYEWNNNSGYFVVKVTVEHTDASSQMFSVDSSVDYAKWACLPDRSPCTPDHAVVETRGEGQYHVILPATLEWGASVPNPSGSGLSIRNAVGTVCLDRIECNGPSGNGQRADPGALAPNEISGELLGKTESGRTYFSVNGLRGPAFQNNRGYFEFDVTIR